MDEDGYNNIDLRIAIVKVSLCRSLNQCSIDTEPVNIDKLSVPASWISRRPSSHLVYRTGMDPTSEDESQRATITLVLVSFNEYRNIQYCSENDIRISSGTDDDRQSTYSISKVNSLNDVRLIAHLLAPFSNLILSILLKSHGALFLEHLEKSFESFPTNYTPRKSLERNQSSTYH